MLLAIKGYQNIANDMLLLRITKKLIWVQKKTVWKSLGELVFPCDIAIHFLYIPNNNNE